MYRLSERSKLNRAGVDFRLIAISDLAIRITKIDFGHPSDSGRRTSARQHELYLNKKSKCDGYKRTSLHQFGKALDFFAYVNGRASWDKEHLAMVAAAFLQAANELGYKIEWGGLWRHFQDYPHIQLVGD